MINGMGVPAGTAIELAVLYEDLCQYDQIAGMALKACDEADNEETFQHALEMLAAGVTLPQADARPTLATWNAAKPGI